MTHRVLITCVQLQRTLGDHVTRLVEHGIEPVVPEVSGQQLSERELLELVPGVSGIIAGDDHITRAVLEQADRLRIISKWGVGTDNIDTEAARTLGIRVTNTPGMFGDEVADVVIGYLVMLARSLHVVDAELRAGRWAKPAGTSLADRTLGIVGLGSIGRAVARRALAMGMRVIGHEIEPERAASGAAQGVQIVSLEDLLATADVVSLNCPLTPESHHLLDGPRFASMKTGAWIINTARGALIDEAALAAALERGHIRAAALDVYEVEPLPAGSPLRKLENVILGSHNGSNTAQAVHRTSVQAIDNLLAGLDAGGPDE